MFEVLTLIGSLAGSAVGLFLPAAMYVAYQRRVHAREILLREVEQAAMDTMQDPMLGGILSPPSLAPAEAPNVKYWTAVPTAIFILGIAEAILGLAATVSNWGTE
ncbi:hypothetical protein Pmar_PMAR025188 [Perkinsus marinus ATCC 50983]|uniref:Uncharacterized protein n=1 Tax=Perkinsus marinus (strain ATCC 50983 / TXsc) TaxID=423536 RepID=C5LGY0_PERM5|nr:hypothetical protein Pmar_PMAR025188 [Perkinsus marinus ATCC 50983]EER04014.1 hypothetical protein Pmar_PMAR025188 [Perkinsus marinus ATCC 50983]|eukprot:XP_002772198.1 hypothetical protein Pmar_PMAR025188 [Perkinsus marinus ATCC 50983]